MKGRFLEFWRRSVSIFGLLRIKVYSVCRLIGVETKRLFDRKTSTMAFGLLCLRGRIHIEIKHF